VNGAVACFAGREPILQAEYDEKKRARSAALRDGPDQFDACPCGSRRPYADCCRPLHEGLPAPDAEALMRSRYTAYVIGAYAYLRETWHPHAPAAA
jgi:hypothetical protein